MNEAYFCTYFDHNYLFRGLALYRSLLRNASPFRLWVLCLDDITYEALRKLELPEVHLIRLADFERGDTELQQAKSNRSSVEYYFTCTPSLILHILRTRSEVDVITYVDADLFFFSGVSEVYKEFENGSILILEHRFPQRLSHLKVHGIYNVGLLAFRRDEAAFECLHWWRERCLEWCYDRVEDGRFADQKYLDDWPNRFRRVVILQDKGAGLAPWNLENYKLEVNKGQVLVDSQPLVFFHFHGLRQVRKWLCDPGLAPYGLRMNSLLKRHIYGPYLRELRAATDWTHTIASVSGTGMGTIRYGARTGDRSDVYCSMFRKIRKPFSATGKLLRNQLFLMIGKRIL